MYVARGFKFQYRILLVLFQKGHQEKVNVLYKTNYKEGNSVVVSTNVELVRGSTIGNATALVVTKITPSRTGILRPRFVRPQTLVPDGNFYSFNSTYKLGILDAVYFTEVDVVVACRSENGRLAHR